MTDHPALDTVTWQYEGDGFEETNYREHWLVVKHVTDSWHIGYINGRTAGWALGPMSAIVNLLFSEVDERAERLELHSSARS